MHIEVEQTVLKSGLAAVSRAVPTKSPMSALLMVQFSAEVDGRLRLTGTDLLMTVEVELECTVQQAGKALVPEKILRDLVNNLSSGPMMLKTLDSRVQLKAGKQTMHLQAGDPADFPVIPRPTATAVTVFSRAAFSLAVQRTAPAAAAPGSGRPVLEGIVLEHRDGLISFTATDGMRLSSQIVPAEVGASWRDVLIPAGPLLDVARMAYGDTVRMHTADTHVTFTLEQPNGATAVSVRLFGETYPDWRRIVTQAEQSTAAMTVTVNREDLLTAIRLAAPFAQTDNRRVTLTVEPADAALVVRSADTSIGAAASTVPMTVLDGQPAAPFSVTAASGFLVDTLAAVGLAPARPRRPTAAPHGDDSSGDDGLVRIRLEGPKKPLIAYAPRFVAVVMPMA